ncbi:uncharacterized protein LOC116853098 [Odontomachus brunneus]|uniref:uncharacterized protein LOC116853098 n=1 Tax=Odontomachus brunneus TaxID=486640 RepID=UPI0013F1C54F|nr:uncharacterized protein LOC116853098 [Odontomachus brunneus]
MKTSIIIVLAVTTVVYGISTDRFNKIRDDMLKCAEEQAWTSDIPNSEVLMCTARKDGKILNTNGELMRDAALQAIEEAFPDVNTREMVQDIYKKCHDKADQSGITGHEQAVKITSCSIPAAIFFLI